MVQAGRYPDAARAHGHVLICGGSAGGCTVRDVPALAAAALRESARWPDAYDPARNRLFMRSGKQRFLKRSMTS